MAPTVNKLLRFLTKLFDEDKLGYASLNTARSAVSTLSIHKSQSLGSHPIIIQYMKGIFNLKPRIPKTTVTWDTSKVLKFLSNWHPAKTYLYINFP